MPDFASAQVVVLSSIDWDAAWQRHQIFATQFAQAGREVFFVENSGFRNPGPRDLPRLWGKLFGGAARRSVNPRPPDGLRLIKPLVLPPTAKPFRQANAAYLVPRLAEVLRRSGLRPGAIAMVHLPSATTLELLRRLAPALTVYDCASNFRDHPQAPADILSLEAELLRRCDLVVCDSDFLFRQKQAEHGRVVQIHQGVSEAFFAVAPSRSDYRRFCQYGTWVPELDCAFLRELAAAGFEVTVSGFIKGPRPEFPDSVRCLPPVPLAELPDRLGAFDAFILPHRITPFHLGVVPAKIFECLAMGRPVLATPLPSLQPFRDLIYIADTPQRWVEIARRLPETESAQLRRRRQELAREHTHTREFGRLVDHLRRAWRDAHGGV